MCMMRVRGGWYLTSSTGTVRRFVVAPTPGTELESTLLVTDAGGFVRQGYVYVGDEPLLRFDAAGNVVYYLEDAMGSVVALVDGSGNKIASFNYDGFGNFRSMSGNTNPPAGIGGDFRFHGAWFEEASGLYHMRAREYDPRTGRFTSLDPEPGTFAFPETLHPYNFANANPLVYLDPSGRFTLIEINIAGSLQNSFQAFRAGAIAKGRQIALRYIGNVVKDEVIKQVQNLFPLPGLPSDWTKGVEFSRTIRDYICQNLHAPDQLFIEVPIDEDGTPRGSGITCNQQIDPKKIMEWVRLGVPRPDFVLGPNPPVSERNGYNKTWVIGELKSTVIGLYREYVKPGSNPAQLNAIANYAAKHTYSRVSLFIVATKGGKARSYDVIRAEFLPMVLKKGSWPIVLVILD